MATKIFVNLPVKDLGKSVTFFKQVGYTFNAQFTDENAACMVISEQIFVMLITEKLFTTFTRKKIADSTTSTEVILSLSADSRDAVDEHIGKAVRAGAAAGDTQDHGWMYTRGYADPDGHLWEVSFMDMGAIPQG